MLETNWWLKLTQEMCGGLKYNVVYCVVQMMERQLKLIDEGHKSWRFDFQDVKITYLVVELIKCLPDLPNKKAFEYKTKYHAHPKHLEDLHWSLNLNEMITHALWVHQLILIRLLLICLIQLPSHKVFVLEQINNIVSLEIILTLLLHTNFVHRRSCLQIIN